MKNKYGLFVSDSGDEISVIENNLGKVELRHYFDSQDYGWIELSRKEVEKIIELLQKSIEQPVDTVK